MKKSPLNDAKWANRDPGTNMTQKEKIENRDLYKKRTTGGYNLIKGYLDADGDNKVEPWEIGLEAGTWMVGGPLVKFGLKGLSKGAKLLKGLSPLRNTEVNRHVTDSTKLAKKFPAKAAMTYGTNLEESLKDAEREGINKNKWRLENNPDMDLSSYGEKNKKNYIESLKRGKFDDDIQSDFNKVIKTGGNQLKYTEIDKKGLRSTEPMRDFPNTIVTQEQIENTRNRYFGNDERSDSPMNHCDSEMMHSGGWGQVRKYNSPGTTGNKEAITHNKKIMNKIGTFNMPHSPLNKGHEVNKDSIASQKAWKDHKADYLKKENGQKEYDMEKGEFFYSPKHNKLKLIPTDDGEVQDRSGIEKWQLAPDRKSSDSSPLDCWKGYERVPGTEEFSDGSCRKKGSPATQKMVTGENTGKIQTDERGEYSLVMDETQQGLKVGDTIRPSNNKLFKPAILGKSLGSRDGYLIGGDYDIEETGDKNYILKNK